MSSLYKLSISGVRSFSPKDHETIQFGTPLTLICGQNGCGKTTIIEALKYATTGDLPPNSKGGAFVNDPTIADRSVVNAEIKLGFISVDGKSMTVTRNMQLNRKRAIRGSINGGSGAGGAANTFKSLEGQLAVVTRGEKTAISTKNLELDTRVPLYLGASKAVLESVIFCHQDDSLWPLSEAGVLKKRFDAIFEASKFTKVLDSLKVIRKDMATDIRVLEQGVQHAKVDKIRALKIKDKVLELSRTSETYSVQIADLTVEIERLEGQANTLFHSNQAFQQTLSEHERIRLLVESIQNTVARLESSVTFLHENDDELAGMAANFGAVKDEKSLRLQTVNAVITDMEANIVDLQQKLQGLVHDEGSLGAKKKEYEANLESLGVLRSDLLGMDENQKVSFLEMGEQLESTEKDLSTQMSRVLADNRSKTSSAKDTLQSSTDDLHKEEERFSYCHEEISATNTKIRDSRNKLSSLSVNEEALETEKSHLESLRTKLEKRKTTQDTQAKYDQIEEDEKTIFRLEQESEEIMRKIHSANKSSDVLSKIELLRDSREVKSSVLQKFVSTHNPAFSGVFGADMVPETAEKNVEDERRNLLQAHSKFVKEAGDLQTVANKRESETTSTEESLTNLRQKMQKHLSAALSVLVEAEIPEYESLVSELEEDYKTAVYNLNTFEVTKSYKTKALDLAKASKCCALCSRGMDDEELAGFVKDMETNLRTVTAKKLNVDVENTAKDLHEMKGINVDVLEFRRLQTETKRLEEGLVGMESNTEHARREFDQFKGKVTECKDRLDAVEALLKPVSDISRLFEETKSLDKQISELEDELSALGVSSVSMGDLQKQQQQKNFEIKSLRQSVTDAIQEGNARHKETARLEMQLKEKELLISNLQLALSEATGVKRQIQDLESHIASLKEKTQRLEQVIAHLKTQQDIARSELAQVERECTEKEETVQTQLTQARSNLESFRRLFDSVTHYEEVDLGRVHENERALADTRADIDEVNRFKKEKEEDARGLQVFINDAANTERNVRDNLELRDLEKQYEQQQKALSAIDIANAETEKEQYQLKSRTLRDKIGALNEQHYGKIGELKQIKDQIQTLQSELDTDFRDVDKQYHDEWIRLQTNLLVSSDLQTYSSALDNAIMKYHSMKMDEINRILRELWTQTYRGTDIDGIEIKCDVATQSKARSYNYRVVMYKKSSELDMRGRCSAGQKVLTSILIRLALAECFGSNCGMIALDEPTTNLDVENAESLANALSNIIEFRKAQKNFQLIVITHDEKFLNHINGGRFVDNFYRIERDERQHSIIKSLPIHVMQDE